MAGYNTEAYWDKVAQEIGSREDLKIIAGDDEPYYRYKRKLFLQLFDTIDFSNKSVLEIGSGPGGNLHHLSQKGCSKIAGVDISPQMVELSKKLLEGKGVEITKIDGLHLPFDNNSFDIIFTSTVLQHNTDDEKLKQLMTEIGRVAAKEVILFERIERTIKGHETNLGRPVGYYEAIMNQGGFSLAETKFLPLQASFFTCGAIRKVFNRSDRKEGEPISRLSYSLESIALPVTRLLDKVIPSRRDLGMLRFKKKP
jgi:ubiquinone/menaquinone biosynthesis C-methylase UbiE